MTKNIRTLGAAAAALVASAALVSASTPASAQRSPEQSPEQSQELEGAPRLFSGQEYDRDRRPDYQHAQRNCSREANREAWDRNYYSAQYDGGPRLDYGRNGWELRGRMRLHNSRGYSYANTVCDLRRNGEVSDFDFLR